MQILAVPDANGAMATWKVWSLTHGWELVMPAGTDKHVGAEVFWRGLLDEGFWTTTPIRMKRWKKAGCPVPALTVQCADQSTGTGDVS